MAVTSFLIQTFFLCSFFCTSQSFNFTFNDGMDDQNLLKFENEATVIANGVARLTNSNPNEIGHVFYRNPIPIFNASLNRSNSFSTEFVFQINPPDSNDGGFGLAFTLSPAPGFPRAEGGHFMGVFNSSNNGSDSNHIFMVEFDTVTGIDEMVDSDGNHVAINLNGMNSTVSEAIEPNFQKSSPIRVWIDFDGVNKQVIVTIARVENPKPIKPSMISPKNLDLSDVLSREMYAGFSAATGGDKWSSHYILGWSFRLNGIADDLDPSRLPKVPPENSPNSNFRIALTAALSTLLLISLASLIAIFLYRRSIMYENLEEWERDCPHRFRYKELHHATKGFNERYIRYIR